MHCWTSQQWHPFFNRLNGVGIYDRDYYRKARPRSYLSAPQSAVVVLILVNVAVWVLDGLFTGEDHRIDAILADHVGTLTHPLLWWQFLTYGFVHAPSPSHIICNMLGLWFLGRDVEDLYGRAEFYRLYLALVVFAGVVWAAANKIDGATGLRRVHRSVRRRGGDRRPLRPEFPPPHPAALLRHPHARLARRRRPGRLGYQGGNGHGRREHRLRLPLGGPPWPSSIIIGGGTSAVFSRGISAGRWLPQRAGPRLHQPEADDPRADDAVHEAEWIESWRRSTARARAV